MSQAAAGPSLAVTVPVPVGPRWLQQAGGGGTNTGTGPGSGSGGDSIDPFTVGGDENTNITWVAALLVVFLVFACLFVCARFCLSRSGLTVIDAGVTADVTFRDRYPLQLVAPPVRELQRQLTKRPRLGFLGALVQLEPGWDVRFHGPGETHVAFICPSAEHRAAGDVDTQVDLGAPGSGTLVVDGASAIVALSDTAPASTQAGLPVDVSHTDLEDGDLPVRDTAAAAAHLAGMRRPRARTAFVEARRWLCVQANRPLAVAELTTETSPVYFEVRLLDLGPWGRKRPDSALLGRGAARRGFASATAQAAAARAMRLNPQEGPSGGPGGRQTAGGSGDAGGGASGVGGHGGVLSGAGTGHGTGEGDVVGMEHACRVAVGWSAAPHHPTHALGYDAASLGFHTDGSLYTCGRNRRVQLHPHSLRAGDVIGCGYELLVHRRSSARPPPGGYSAKEARRRARRGEDTSAPQHEYVDPRSAIRFFFTLNGAMMTSIPGGDGIFTLEEVAARTPRPGVELARGCAFPTVSATGAAAVAVNMIGPFMWQPVGGYGDYRDRGSGVGDHRGEYGYTTQRGALAGPTPIEVGGGLNYGRGGDGASNGRTNGGSPAATVSPAERAAFDAIREDAQRVVPYAYAMPAISTAAAVARAARAGLVTAAQQRTLADAPDSAALEAARQAGGTDVWGRPPPLEAEPLSAFDALTTQLGLGADDKGDLRSPGAEAFADADREARKARKKAKKARKKAKRKAKARAARRRSAAGDAGEGHTESSDDSEDDTVIGARGGGRASLPPVRVGPAGAGAGQSTAEAPATSTFGRRQALPPVLASADKQAKKRLEAEATAQMLRQGSFRHA